MVPPKKLAMMLVTVEAGHVVGHALSLSLNSIELPTEWDHSNELVNIDDELLGLCSRRIAQQRTSFFFLLSVCGST